MSNEGKTLFRVHFRVEMVSGSPLQPKTYDVLAESPYQADCMVRRAHAGKRVFIDKCKVLKENKNA